jgi:hypothetical protein
MKKLTSSDLFNYVDNGKMYSKLIAATLQSKDIHIVNDNLKPQLESITKFYKITIMRQVNTAIEKKRIILYYTDDPNIDIPVSLPFFKLKKNNQNVVMVNLTRFINVRKDKSGKEIIDYDIDIKQLFSFVMPAYYQLEHFDDDCVLPAKAIEDSAIIWANMFNKINIRILGISSDGDKYDTFKYFAMMYFMINILDTPARIAENIALKNLYNGKPALAVEIEDKLDAKEINIYSDFKTLCDVLFSTEYTRVRPANKGVSTNIDFVYYMKSFIRQYGFSAVFSLAAYPYFIFTIFAARTMSHMNNVNAFDDIIKGKYEKECSELINTLNSL